MSSELKDQHRQAAIAKASGFTQNIEDNIGVEFSTPLLKQLTQQWNITPDEIQNWRRRNRTAKPIQPEF